MTRDNLILVLEQEDEICSMLHLNPYRLSVQGTEVDAYYYVAVATKEDCRHQGMMRKLLHRSLTIPSSLRFLTALRLKSGWKNPTKPMKQKMSTYRRPSAALLII